MKRFKKILFVNDCKTERTEALERTVKLAKTNEAILTVIEALEEFPSEMQMAIPSSDLKDFQKIVGQESIERLENLVAPIKEEGVNVTTKILWGTPWLEIIREVLRNNHDLVMLSPQKEGKLKELLFGSRIMHLMRKCPCPVWAIKPTKPKKYERILAAVDMVPLNDERNSLNMKIMGLSTSLASSEKSELHVVHCWQHFYERMLRGRSGLRQEDVNKIILEAKNTHKKWLNQLIKRFHIEDLSIKAYLLEGEPGELIVQLANKKRIDLVVMGTVSRTGLAGFFIGNTAEKVLHGINCSVLAVKPDGFVTPVTLD